MAAQSGAQDPDVSTVPAPLSWYELSRRLREQPFTFRFFQAVQVMERLAPERARVGEFADPSQEVVHFGCHPSLAFPASDIQSISWDEGLPKMYVNFMGLIGPSGLLPRTYTEFIENRVRARDRSSRDFLDMFHHRMISLFYGAWLKYRLPAIYGRRHQDRFSEYLYALVGMAPKSLRGRQRVEDESLILYTGLLALQPHSGVALESILEDYFGVPVELEQFIGTWYTLESDSLCDFDDEEGVSQALGLGAVVGDQIWDQHSMVRIRLGPLTLEQYKEFLPGRLGYRRLRDITRFYSRDQLDFEVQLILRREDVPGCLMEPRQEPNLQLGWTTWVKTQPEFQRDPEDTVLVLH